MSSGIVGVWLANQVMILRFCCKNVEKFESFVDIYCISGPYLCYLCLEKVTHKLNKLETNIKNVLKPAVS